MATAVFILMVGFVSASAVLAGSVRVTVLNRHIDRSLTLATQTMETSVGQNCGSSIVDPVYDLGATLTAAVTTAMNQRFQAERNRCAWHAVTPTAVTDPQSTAATCRTRGGTYHPGWAATTPITESTLGSRSFVVNSLRTNYCIRHLETWRWVKPVSGLTEDRRNNTYMRLQRTIEVQWTDGGGDGKTYKREIVQLGAIPPDSVVSGRVGRVVVAVASKDVHVQMKAKGGPTSGAGAFVEYAATQYGTSWFVEFPFLALNEGGTTETYEYRKVTADGTAPATWTTIILTPSQPVACIASSGATVIPTSTWDGKC